MSKVMIEYHILQSFPVTCLNRDDVGAPKTAMVGGVTRARVSSQCWKRYVRLALRDMGVKIGMRTKKVEELLVKEFIRRDLDSEKARECATAIATELVDDTLLFISGSELVAFVDYAIKNELDKSKLKAKELARIAKKTINSAIDALDIALFGRMVAKASEMQVQAAASFAHALSTHRVSNEVEFFTALDDLNEEPGSAHMGNVEFNSATYYRYVSLDTNQLRQTLGDISLGDAVEHFTKALFVAVPAARQTTQSGASPWEFARIMVRSGQRIQVPFETPIKSREGGFLKPSIDALKDYLDKKEQMAGSLFGRLGSYEWGEDENRTLDDIVISLRSHVE
jgi:CRISPR system Cascade subunit CasC